MSTRKIKVDKFANTMGGPQREIEVGNYPLAVVENFIKACLLERGIDVSDETSTGVLCLSSDLEEAGKKNSDEHRLLLALWALIDEEGA